MSLILTKYFFHYLKYALFLTFEEMTIWGSLLKKAIKIRKMKENTYRNYN